VPDWPAVTDRVIIGVTALVVAYDVIAVLVGGGDASISARLQHHAVRYPVIPFAIGGICMHVFWPVFGIRD
jgi:hypothetical protein